MAGPGTAIGPATVEGRGMEIAQAGRIEADPLAGTPEAVSMATSAVVSTATVQARSTAVAASTAIVEADSTGAAAFMEVAGATEADIAKS